jgi:SNF2 family DNA or RNA helicase
MDPGLGKTFTSYLYLKHHPDALPALVICPASVKFHWEREAKRVLNNPNIFIAESTTPRDIVYKSKRPDIVIINYDILQYWMKWLYWYGAETIIIDECQMLSSPRSVRTICTRAICLNVPHVLALSGTPFLNRVIELWPVLSILQPKVWGNRARYAERYCPPKLTPWGWNFNHTRHLDELHEELKRRVLVRHNKREVLKDLPDKFRCVMPVPLRDPDEYQRAENDFRNWIQKYGTVKARRALKTEGFSKVGYLMRLASQEKLPAVIDWLNNWLDQSEEKMVFFAHHRAFLDGLRQGCRYSSVTIDGSVPSNKRGALTDKFQQDPRVRVLFGEHKAAGVGTNLTAAHNVAIAELPWNPGTAIQNEDRCWRIGTTKDVSVYYLVAHDTIEEKVLCIIQRRQETFNEVIDGNGRGEQLGVYDELLIQMGKEMRL